MSILDVRDLTIQYLSVDHSTSLRPAQGVSTGQDALLAVEGVSFSLEQGRSLGLVGESGCGKTTVMLSLLRLLPEAGRITRGQILFNGQDLLQISEREMRAIRWNGISMVFQGAMNALNPVRTVESQIIEAIQHPDMKINSQQAVLRAGELLELVGIPAKRGKQYPHQFSGGMKQRAVIAMALACNPSVLIADEPTTALDVMIQAQIIELLETLQKELNLALVIVTHDLGVVAEMCDEVLVMYGGTLAEYANSDTIFNDPRHPYTQRLLRAFPDIAEPGSELASIPGSPPRLDDLPPGCRFQPRCQFGEEQPICVQQRPDSIEIAPGHRTACHLIAELER